MAKKPKVHTVESILDELRKAMRQGLGKKRLSKKASDYWEDNHLKAVQRRLSSGAANWDKDKKRALPAARKLGTVARLLANKGVVLHWATEAAHAAVKRDPKWPTGTGAVGYNDF